MSKYYPSHLTYCKHYLRPWFMALSWLVRKYAYEKDGVKQKLVYELNQNIQGATLITYDMIKLWLSDVDCDPIDVYKQRLVELATTEREDGSKLRLPAYTDESYFKYIQNLPIEVEHAEDVKRQIEVYEFIQEEHKKKPKITFKEMAAIVNKRFGIKPLFSTDTEEWYRQKAKVFTNQVKSQRPEVPEDLPREDFWGTDDSSELPF